MKKIGLFIALGFVFVSSAIAGNESEKTIENKEVENTEATATYSLQGSVYDPVCQDAISGATIIVDGKKYYSDLSGNFEVPTLAKGKHTISVDFVSYQNKTIEVDLDQNQNMEIQLQQQ